MLFFFIYVLYLSDMHEGLCYRRRSGVLADVFTVQS